MILSSLCINNSLRLYFCFIISIIGLLLSSLSFSAPAKSSFRNKLKNFQQTLRSIPQSKGQTITPTEHHHRRQHQHHHNDEKYYHQNNDDLAKVMILYFPQFHEDSLNNQLWGKGFTDWDNVRQCQPPYNRYNTSILQPPLHPPPALRSHSHPSSSSSAEFNRFYDLTNLSIRQYHGDLMKQYEIDGFIYHHYWFYHPEANQPQIYRPLQQMIQDHQPNTSLFAFNWASDNWEGSWSGRGNTGELLYEQFFPYENLTAIQEHYHYLRQFFHLPNYWKWHQQIPILFVYPRVRKPLELVLEQLSDLAIKDGFPSPGLYVIGSVMTMSNHELYTSKLHYEYQHPIIQSELFYPFATFPNQQTKIPSRCLHYYQYENASVLLEEDHSYLGKEDHHHRNRIHYLSTLTQFDNTPRRTLQDAQIWNRSFSPFWNPYQSFEYDLKNLFYYEKCCQRESLRKKTEKFIVLNAWNEWAEGMAIEPSLQHGEQWLKSIKKVKKYLTGKSCRQYQEIEEYFTTDWSL